jgi:hypothetical protein
MLVFFRRGRYMYFSNPLSGHPHRRNVWDILKHLALSELWYSENAVFSSQNRNTTHRPSSCHGEGSEDFYFCALIFVCKVHLFSLEEDAIIGIHCRYHIRIPISGSSFEECSIAITKISKTNTRRPHTARIYSPGTPGTSPFVATASLQPQVQSARSCHPAQKHP